MPQVKVILIGRQPATLAVPRTISVAELKEELRGVFKLPRVVPVFKGRSLDVDSERLQFSDGDTLLATVPQRPPSSQSNFSASDPDADITFRLKPTDSALKKWLYSFCAQRLKLPNLLLYWMFSIRPVHYLLFLCWMILSPIAARHDLGPIYIIGTIFLIIVFNLGVRREGELSGYSLFNPNVQALPGQLQADQIDRQVRRGNM